MPPVQGREFEGLLITVGQKLDSRYRELTQEMYPSLASGIGIATNGSDRSQVLYDLHVFLEQGMSDGINAARVLLRLYPLPTLPLSAVNKLSTL